MNDFLKAMSRGCILYILFILSIPVSAPSSVALPTSVSSW